MISMAFSQFDNTVAGWGVNNNFIVPNISYAGEMVIADEGTLAAESLDEVDFATHAKWDITNDFDDTGGNAAFVWSANQTSTLTQTAVNQATLAIAASWYTFTYTLAVTTTFDGDGAATITTGYALTAVPLEIVTAGTYTLYFKSAVAPVDFVISLVSGSDTEGTISYDDLSLKQITGGDAFIGGALNVVGNLKATGSIIAKNGFATELWDVAGGHFETATTGVEYYSPNQNGGIYGTIYRQYFTTALPSSLTSGSIITGMIDYSTQFKYTGTDRGVGHGNATAYGSSDNHIYIMLSGATGSGNISLAATGYVLQKGWIDYTK